jgi:outer membrane protein TolC
MDARKLMLRVFGTRIARLRNGIASSSRVLLVFAALNSGIQLGAQAPPDASSPAQGLTLIQAIQSALQNHPVLMSQQAQVEISRGQREQSSSIFDSTTQAGLSQRRTATPLLNSQFQPGGQAGPLILTQNSNLIDYSLDFSRLFRNGVSAQSTFAVGRNTDNFAKAIGLNTSNMNLAVSLPQERASIAEVDAALFDVNQLMSQLISTTATSYWNLVAARKNLAIAVEAEDRGRIYGETVQALVDADHVPRNDLNDVTANLAQRTATRIVLEQEAIAAQAQLALNMGKKPSEILEEIGELADDFPYGEDQKVPSNTSASLKYFLEESLDRRADYFAAQRRNAGAGMLLTAAKNRVLPQVDFSVGAGYSGMGEGRNGNSFFAAPVSNVGPNAYAGITYVFSGRNQAARGALRQASAATQQAELKADELARNIGAQVVIADQAVINSILGEREMRRAVKAFQAALSGEREKYRAGMGSIVDVLIIEDKLNNALIQQVQAQLAYALAVVQFRFATGTLLQAPDRTDQNISADIFISLPFTAAPQERH